MRMSQKQYSVDFFNSVVESLQRACQSLISFDHVVEISGYLALEIDNMKKERYVLSEFVQSNGNVISESFCTKSWRSRLTVQRQNRPRDVSSFPHATPSVYGVGLPACDKEKVVPPSSQQAGIRHNIVREKSTNNEKQSSPFMNRGQTTTPISRAPPSNPVPKGPPSKPFLKGPPSNPFLKGPPSNPFLKGTTSNPVRIGPPSNPVLKGPPSNPVLKGPPSNTFLKGTTSNPILIASLPNPVLKGPPSNPVLKGPPSYDAIKGPPSYPVLAPPSYPVLKGPPSNLILNGAPFYRVNKRPPSTFVNNGVKRHFNCKPPVQNVTNKMSQKPNVGSSGQIDAIHKLQHVPVPKTRNIQAQQSDGRVLVVKSDPELHWQPNQTDVTSPGTPSNTVGQGNVQLPQGSVGQGNPLQCTEVRRSTLGTSGRVTSSKSPQMPAPMYPANVKAGVILGRQFCNVPGRGGGTRKNIQKHLEQSAPPVTIGPQIFVSPSQVQFELQNIVTLSKEVTKKHIMSSSKAQVAESSSDILSSSQTQVAPSSDIVSSSQPQIAESSSDILSTVKPHIAEVSRGPLLIRERGTVRNGPEIPVLHVSKSKSGSFKIDHLCPVLAKMPAITKCTTTHLNIKEIPHLDELLQPLSPIVVIDSLSSALLHYNQPIVTASFKAATVAPFPTSSRTNTGSEDDANSVTKTSAQLGSVTSCSPSDVPSPLTTLTSVPLSDLGLGHAAQGSSNSPPFKESLEDLSLGPPAKHPKLSGKKMKEKAAVKKQAKKGRRKSSHPRKADNGVTSEEEKYTSGCPGPTNRTLRSAANPVKMCYSEGNECENDLEDTDQM